MHGLLIRAIVATQPDLGIGVDGDLLYKIPNDLRLFKQKTTGGAVIMGRKTYESLPSKNGLAERANIVVSRRPKPEHVPKHIHWVGTPIEALRLAPNTHTHSEGSPAKAVESIWVIGGSQVYDELLPYCQEFHVTSTYENADKTPDTYLKPLGSNWLVVSVDVTEGIDSIPDHKVSIYQNIRKLPVPAAK